MPLYEYQCRACRKTAEVRHGFKETYDAPCAECGGEMARVFSPAGIVFKGSGFYLTDSRKAAEAAKSGEGKSSTSSESSAKPAASSEGSSTAAAPAASAAPAAPAASTPSTPAKSESAA
jgi:putative FmdB family regulatory protein